MRRRSAGRIGGPHDRQRSVPQVTDVIPSAGNPLDVSSDVAQLFVDGVIVDASGGRSSFPGLRAGTCSG